MSPIGNSYGSWNGAAQNSAARRFALQKPSAASSFSSDNGEQASPGADQYRHRSHENLHRSGTGSAVPFRHESQIEAPRLVSAFVAQLLGQILPDAEQRRLPAGLSYEPDQGRSSALFDKRL